MKVTTAIVLFVVIVSATILGNLVVAKIISDQAGESLKANSLLKLFSIGS